MAKKKTTKKAQAGFQLIDMNQEVPSVFPIKYRMTLSGGWKSFSGFLRGTEFKNGICEGEIKCEADWFTIQRLALIIPEISVEAFITPA